jgi:hypothetical protein
VEEEHLNGGSRCIPTTATVHITEDKEKQKNSLANPKPRLMTAGIYKNDLPKRSTNTVFPGDIRTLEGCGCPSLFQFRFRRRAGLHEEDQTSFYYCGDNPVYLSRLTIIEKRWTPPCYTTF